MIDVNNFWRLFYLIWLCVIFSMLLVNVNIVCGLEAPTVHLPDQGILVGTYLKMFRTQNIKAYLGIEYARAKRFSAPEVFFMNQQHQQQQQRHSGQTTRNRSGGMLYNASTYGPKCWPHTSATGKDNNQQQQRQKHNDNNNNNNGNSNLKDTTNYIQQLLKMPMSSTSAYGSPTSATYGSSISARDGYDENCLYLNIFIPDGSPGLKGYAVIVWFHGGDFSTGSALDVDPFQMVFKQKVIVVTVAYRLSILGFLTTGDSVSPGNFGLMDQSAALFWIRKNIGHFGGNAQQITIMGHTAGAVSAFLHLTSGEWSKNAFHKVIIMSGNPLSTTTPTTTINQLGDSPLLVHDFEFYRKAVDELAETFGCDRKPSDMLMKCLCRLDVRILMDNIPDFQWGPVIDERFYNDSASIATPATLLSITTTKPNVMKTPFIRSDPMDLLKKKLYHQVPIMMGITDMEDVLSILEEEELNDGSHFTVEQFDERINRLVNNDIQKFNDTDLQCNNFSIITASIDLLYKNNENIRKKELISDYIRLRMDREHLAPLFQLANLLTKNSDDNFNIDDHVSSSNDNSFNSNNGNPMPLYIYYFNTRPRTDFYKIPDWIGVPRYFDQIFVWGVPYKDNNNNNNNNKNMNINNNKFMTQKMINRWNSTDKKITDIVMTLWANFAKASNPTAFNIYLKWNPYSIQNNQTYLIINEDFPLELISTNSRMKFWNNYYPKLLDFTMLCCINEYDNGHYLYCPKECFSTILLTVILLIINSYNRQNNL